MTAFDLAAVLILVVSALIGFSRGAVREIITVFAFSVAAVLALYALPFTAPLARKLVHPAWAGAAAAVVVVFVIAYVAMRVLGGAVTTHLHASPFGGVNRVVGAGFGGVRAIVLIGAFALVFNAVTPLDLQPRWITGGLAWPAARGAGLGLAAFAPKGMTIAGGLGKVMGDGVKKGFSASDEAIEPQVESAIESAPARTPPKLRGYQTHDRRGLDTLVERTR